MSDISITETHINALFNQSSLEDIRIGKKTTVVCCTLPNGFNIVESSSCIDPENYRHDIGKNLCFRRIKDKMWELEGYLLQQEKYEAILEPKVKPIEGQDCSITGSQSQAFEYPGPVSEESIRASEEKLEQPEENTDE